MRRDAMSSLGYNFVHVCFYRNYNTAACPIRIVYNFLFCRFYVAADLEHNRDLPITGSLKIDISLPHLYQMMVTF